MSNNYFSPYPSHNCTSNFNFNFEVRNSCSVNEISRVKLLNVFYIFYFCCCCCYCYTFIEFLEVGKRRRKLTGKLIGSKEYIQSAQVELKAMYQQLHALEFAIKNFVPTNETDGFLSTMTVSLFHSFCFCFYSLYVTSGFLFFYLLAIYLFVRITLLTIFSIFASHANTKLQTLSEQVDALKHTYNRVAQFYGEDGDQEDFIATLVTFCQLLVVCISTSPSHSHLSTLV
jgi:hypothetical protein